MKSLIYRDNYESYFKRHLKNALIFSISIHLIIISAVIVKSKVQTKRLYYAPVYNVNLVSSPPAVKSASKSAGKKPSPKKPDKPKPSPKKPDAPKPPKKIIPPKNSLKYADEFHKNEKEEIRSEDALRDAIAKIRDKVADEDKLKDTLEKIKGKVDEDEPEDAKVIATDSGDKTVSEENERGVLTSDMMNLNLYEKKYYDTIWKKIKEAWILPTGISDKDKDLETIIVIKVEKNGRVSDIIIEKKSGTDYYDQSAIRAIKKAEPFPTFIEGMSVDYFKVGLRFRPTKN